MSGGETNEPNITAQSLLSQMFGEAVVDRPLTHEAVHAARLEVDARLAKARELLAGAEISPDRPYDETALVAAVLIDEEQVAAEMATARRHDVIDGFSPAAVEYMDFLDTELAQSGKFGEPVLLRIHFPAPPDMTGEQLETLAEKYRADGWNAEVAPLDAEADDSPLGIKIVKQSTPDA